MWSSTLAVHIKERKISAPSLSGVEQIEIISAESSVYLFPARDGAYLLSVGSYEDSAETADLSTEPCPEILELTLKLGFTLGVDAVNQLSTEFLVADHYGIVRRAGENQP